MAFAWFGWIIFDIGRDAKIFLDRGSRIEELRGVIVHLDEVLTMSARMAAATGDSRWEERYHHFEPQLDAAIKETIRIGAGLSNIKAATKTDAANIKLVEMENRAFALVRAGRKEEAQTVLFSPEYETQKQIYAEGITSFVDQIRREVDEGLREEQRIDLLSIIAAVVVGGTSFVAWLSAARGVRRWRAQLLDSFHRRAEAEENLRKAHAELEVRVKERTADLAKTNETLQAEISERKRAEWQLNIQYAVSRVLTESSTLKEASARILQTVCENLNWEVGEFYTVDRRAGVMRFDDMWSAPNAQIDAFITLSRQTTFARGIGLPGRVWASGKPIWISDVDVDENFPRAAAAKQVGLHSAFSFPILTGNEVSGVIEFFSREIRQPDEELLRMFAVLGSQLGQFFERKRAEAAQQSSEAHTKAIVQSSLDCIVTIDHEGKILEFNPAAEIVFGYPRAKVLGMELAEVIIPPSLREQHRQGMMRYLATGEAKVLGKRIEIVAIRSDGSEFPVELAITRLGAEEPPMFTGFIRDITERKRAEAAAQRSQKRLRDLIDGVGPSMFVGLMTPQGILIECNRPALAAAGLKPEDVLGKPFEETHWWAHSPEAQQQLREAIARAARGEASRYDVQVRAAENHLIDVDFSLQPLRDETGEVVFLVPSASVITERKQAENALRESKHFAESIAENSTNIIYLFDLETSRNAYTNRSVAEFLGYSQAQILELGDNVLPTIIHPEDLARLAQHYAHFATCRTVASSISSIA